MNQKWCPTIFMHCHEKGSDKKGRKIYGASMSCAFMPPILSLIILFFPQQEWT
jgi:hypothetical protein